jgi:hypothetical protein
VSKPEDRSEPDDDDAVPPRRRQQPPRRPRPQRPRRQDDYDDDEPPDDGGVSTLIPYRNGFALGGYYCGVFSLIPGLGMILGPTAVVLGIMALNYVKKYPTAKGTGHAIAALVLGGLTTLGHLACLGFFVVAIIAGSTHH